MTQNELIKQIESQIKQLDALGRRTLPIKVGELAKRHYQGNFLQSGFVNGGIKPWAKSLRQSGKGTTAGYGTLMSGHKFLYNSVKYTPSENRVKIYNDVPYAPIHNFGGIVSPTVTPKMRRFAWAKFFEATGKASSKTSKTKKKQSASNLELNSEAQKWKGLALTKKTKLTIKMPQRQFIGESKELSDQISQLIDTEVSKIMHKGTSKN